MAQRHRTHHRPIEGSSEPDDVFVAKVFEASTWARRNSQTLILLGVVAAVLLGGAIYYASYRRNLNRQAVAELESAQRTLQTGDIEGGKAALTRYVERFGSTSQAGEARLLLGQTYLATGQPEQAIQTLEKGRVRDPMGVQTLSLLAKAYEQIGRFPDAEREYLEVADEAPLEFQRREALSDAARVRQHVGNHAGAAELYRRILQTLQESQTDERGLYELRLAEAEHAAR